MPFFELREQLDMLNNLIGQLSNEQFTNKIGALGDATIGQHTRHIVELLGCAVSGYQTGVVDYDNRQRDIRIETDTDFAKDCIFGLLAQAQQPDKSLFVRSRGEQNDHNLRIPTSYFREVLYNTEHIIHHLALIRVALRSMQLDIVPANFGIAYSTIAYRQ